MTRPAVPNGFISSEEFTNFSFVAKFKIMKSANCDWIYGKAYRFYSSITGCAEINARNGPKIFCFVEKVSKLYFSVTILNVDAPIGSYFNASVQCHLACAFCSPMLRIDSKCTFKFWLRC